MKNYTFAWEIQTLLEQFVAAFNDVIVKRYDKDKNVVAPLEGHKVRYVYAPKQRVFNFLTTPAPGGITVPVIAVNISGISRDNNRVFNKNQGFSVAYNPKDGSGSYIKTVLQPVPININVNMTIVTKYQSDMDQIITNFIPYCDPYIIISWKLPAIVDSSSPYEIRSEILWGGNINLNYPVDLQPTQSFRITADTSFTIKGWLFKKMDESINKIYTIQSVYNDGMLLVDDPAKSLIQSFEDVFGPWETYYGTQLPEDQYVDPITGQLPEENILENAIVAIDGTVLVTFDESILINIQ
jgi:hypothetical protein